MRKIIQLTALAILICITAAANTQNTVISKGKQVASKAKSSPSVPLKGGANVSFYGAAENSRTASGVRYRRNQSVGTFTAAVEYKRPGTSPCIPFFTMVKLTNTRSGKSIVITVTDTGSYKSPPGRGVWFDLTPSAFRALGLSANIGRTRPNHVIYEILPEKNYNLPGGYSKYKK